MEFHSVVKLREVAKEHLILQEVAMGHLRVTACTNRTVTIYSVYNTIQFGHIFTPLHFYTILIQYINFMFKYRDNVNIDDQ